ncbi:MAG: sigma 54-interacting transcriptional regulator, partial [Myxococcota bacterium]
MSHSKDLVSPEANVTLETAAASRLEAGEVLRYADLGVIFGADTGAHTAIEARTVVGRSRACTVTLQDSAVSSKHAEIRKTGGQLVIQDLGSRNGTFVNGRRITEPTVVGRDAVVRVGDTLLAMRVDARERWEAPSGDRLVGGAALSAIRRKVRLVGPTELPVLLLGETGTGKDVVARQLHLASGREGPFVPVNCAALPESLAEAELFGHTKAAFTGAQKASPGLFAAADKGTLFLDEVGELPPLVQAKLLRVLEDQRVRPVGSVSERQVDVRILSATNRDVRAPEAFEFRSDLLARLAGVEIRLPPLRDRRQDIPALTEHLLARTGNARAIHIDAMEALCLADWPMNVRELAATLRAAVLESSDTLTLGDLPTRVRGQFEEARDGSPVAVTSTS